jgi:nucleoside-diphosphate-sugar epimerase
MISNNNSQTGELVTVTGASGFIAMHCILKLLEQGYRVRGTLRTPSRGDGICQALGNHVDVGDCLEFVKADLTSDDGWAEAMAGATYLLHVASPLPRKPPKHESELIDPARDGALRALKAATAAGVKSVVMTSSVAAVAYGHDRSSQRVFDESDWSELGSEVGAYEKSKTIAERAAWDYVDNLPAESRFAFAVVNPGLVLGPVLDSDYGTSGEVVRKLMKRELPGCPDVHWAMVDVRDVADAHVAAMTNPNANRKRFIVANAQASMIDVARILKNNFSSRGYKIPVRRLPNWLVRVAAIFDKTTRLVLQELGYRRQVTSARAEKVLAWKPRPLEEMVVSMGESLIEHGVV